MEGSNSNFEEAGIFLQITVSSNNIMRSYTMNSSQRAKIGFIKDRRHEEKYFRKAECLKSLNSDTLLGDAENPKDGRTSNRLVETYLYMKNRYRQVTKKKQKKLREWGEQSP